MIFERMVLVTLSKQVAVYGPPRRKPATLRLELTVESVESRNKPKNIGKIPDEPLSQILKAPRGLGLNLWVQDWVWWRVPASGVRDTRQTA
jgi:hypothetical protein